INKVHAFSITPPSCQLAGEIIIPFKYKHFADSATDESRSEESASNNEGINEERSCSAPPNKLPKLSNPDDQAGVSGIEDVVTKGPVAATSGSTTGTKIDLGTVVKAAEGSWGVLKRLSQEITDEKRMQYLTFHWKPSESDILHSHQVTKGKKTWKVSFQFKWLKQFPWLCYITKGTTPGCIGHSTIPEIVH
ncbi:unnamed protein product, partial [Pocillopora meandrina]